MQITDSDFTRPKDEYSSYFGRPYDVLVVSDDQTTVNMDPCYSRSISTTFWKGCYSKFASTHLYTWVDRGTVRVKCLV